jgi:hypothetical protein
MKPYYNAGNVSPLQASMYSYLSSTSLICHYFDTCANQLLSTFRLKYFSGYVHIDVVVKSSEMSSMHEDVKFKFISLFGVTAQKLDMKITYIKTIIKAYVMN